MSEAFLFDGRSAAALPVRVEVGAGRLVVTGAEGAPLRDVPLAALALSEPFASAPRLVGLPDGETLEVPDAGPFTAALGEAGRPPGPVARLQQSRLATAASLLLVVAALAAGYRFGLPAASRAIARALPPSVEASLGTGVLASLDAGLLRPSTLPEARREALARSFERLAARVAPGVPARLVHRRGQGLFARNAFALPGGTVVLLDGIPELVAGQEVVVAVLAHELCHLAERDPTRALLQATGLAAAAGLVWGDISAQAANTPALLLSFRYSRELEAAADACAVQRLREAGLPARSLLGALLLLEADERSSGRAALPAFLSTHPPMDARLASLRREPDVGEAPVGWVDAKRALATLPGPPDAAARELQRQVSALGDAIASEPDPARKEALRAQFRRLRERALAAREALEGEPEPERLAEALRLAGALGEERRMAAVFVSRPPGLEAEDLTGELARRLGAAR